MTAPRLLLGAAAAVAGALSAIQDPVRAPLPSAPPMNSPGWTVLVPALLFLVTAGGTWALWRHFADKDDED